jgi:predicted metalloendopeptidase
MAKVHISANRATAKTIRAIDRKREQERRKMFHQAKENAEALAAKLVQRLIDKEIIETTSVQPIRECFEEQLKQLSYIDDFDLQMKVAPVRTLAQDPNIVSLYLTQYIVEDLINHPDIQDVFGDDLDVYLAVDSVFRVLRSA